MCVVRSQTKAQSRKPPTPLAKGQLWRTKDAHIQIVDRGRMLVHYKILRELGQARRTQMSRVESMESYLKEHKALLVEEAAAK